MAQFEAYHGKTSQHHQQRFNALAPKGWRMISLSVHGDPGSPQYSAVWVKEAGPAYVATHDLPIGQYQKWFTDQTNKGFVPVLLSATGSGSNAIVAAVFEKGVKGGWVAKHGLISGSEHDQNTIEYWCKRNRRDGMVLQSGAIYGSLTQRQYIAVWHYNAEAHWNWRTADTSATYQAAFNAFNEGGLRPGFAAPSSSQIYLSAFRDDSIGEWHARHNMTAAKYQTEFDDFKGKGFYPISVQGGGAGSSTRYAAIFAKRHAPHPRKWTVNGNGLAKFDALFKKFMQDNGVRSAQFSIAKNNVFKAQRAYTWADPTYPVTQPTDVMRVASLSKMFTCACIRQLIADTQGTRNPLTEATRVFPRLGITAAALNSQTVDNRVNNITVRHLIDHEGGWDRNSSTGDYIFKMRKISQDLGLNRAPTKDEIARWVFGERLTFAPGARSEYSNTGYTVLARLVEVVSGQNYQTYLRNRVLQPIGINDVWVSRILRSQRRANEVFQDDPGIGLSAVQPNQDRNTALCYGGEGWTTEAMDGSGGLCCSATSLVQFIHHQAVWDMGGRAAGAARTGGMAGVSSRAQSMGGGVDFGFIFNSRYFLKSSIDDFATELVNLINSTSL